MKKLNLIFVTVLCLIFGITAVVSAQGFYVGLGYEDLSNDLTIKVPDLANLKIDLNTPCKLYTADLGYEFNQNYTIEANYSWGTTDLAGLKINPYPGETIEADLDEDNSIFSVEGRGKFQVAKSFYLTGIIGYAEYKTTASGTLDLSWVSSDYSADIKQTIKGAYLGAGVSYQPIDRLELGATYRQMIDPSGSLRLDLNDAKYDSTHLHDLDYSALEIYTKVNINQNWTAIAQYTKAMTDYSVSGADVSCDTSGLTVKCQYKF